MFLDFGKISSIMLLWCFSPGMPVNPSMPYGAAPMMPTMPGSPLQLYLMSFLVHRMSSGVVVMLLD